MAVKSKVVSVEDAVARIPDGSTVSICGAWVLVPESTLKALEDRFLLTGHPRDLTAVFPICPGDLFDQRGIDHLAHKGLLRRAIGGSYPTGPSGGSGSPLRSMIQNNEIEAYNLPSGMLAHWLREVGARRPGVLTRVGLGTFVDPRVSGGRMNESTPHGLLSVVDVAGNEALFMPSFPVDVSIIRATTADELGNLTMEHEGATLTAFAQAAAARSSGGMVIAQVKRIAEARSLDPHLVKVPGHLVDYVVVDPDQMQASKITHDPSVCGEIKAPLPLPPAISDMDRLIVSRAAREIRDGDVIVLGFGISALVPHLLIEQNRFDRVSCAIEQGSTGGLPLSGFQFGSSLNPQTILDAGSQFDLFQGGCFDRALLSFVQVDPAGRVNVHRVDKAPNVSAGIGGFLDIVSGARRLLFLGYFTAGGMQVEVQNDCLRIIKEGRSRKFVERLDHVSFDPHYSAVEEVLYITERAVFRWTNDGLMLTEVAPGVDLERDIFAQMGFRPQVASSLQQATLL
jgi:propionate CoA-transferase